MDVVGAFYVLKAAISASILEADELKDLKLPDGRDLIAPCALGRRADQHQHVFDMRLHRRADH
jgi:hypothetical protein